MPPSDLLVHPIGFVRSPFNEKVEAPRQARLAEDAAGTVEVLPKYADGLIDLATFDRIWLVFWFDQAAPTDSLKVLPPRSSEKRGVFATRSPHRPNPIGLSAVRLERIEGTTLHIRELDLVDGTPILDIKPYIPYADAFPEASSGWLEESGDPRPMWLVELSPEAEEACTWVHTHAGLDLRGRIVSALALGPQPHAYRRIKGDTLAVKEWRARFRDAGDMRLIVDRIESGYSERDLAKGTDPVHDVHRSFISR